jgi:hypothetical protein
MLPFLESLDQPLRGKTDCVDVQEGHVIGYEKDTNDNQKNTRRHVNDLDIMAKFLRKLEKGVHSDGAQKKRHSQPCCVGS